MTPKQRLRTQLPSVCDPEWLATLKLKETVIYCWGGGAGHLYPRFAKVVKKRKTFIDIEIDGYAINGEPYSTRISSDGMRRWYDVSYFAFIAPLSRLKAQFDEANNRRSRFNQTATAYGLTPHKISTFESVYHNFSIY